MPSIPPPVRRWLGRIRRSPFMVASIGMAARQRRRWQQRIHGRFVRGVRLKTRDYVAHSPYPRDEYIRTDAGGVTLIGGASYLPSAPPDHTGGPLYVRYPERFVAALRQPFVMGYTGGIVTADRRLLWDVSYEWPGRPDSHTAYDLVEPGPVPRLVPGTLAVLASAGADANYFHLLCNSVPRLAMLESAGLLEQADHFLVSGTVTPWVSELWRVFGLDPAKLIGAGEAEAFCPEQALVPSLVVDPFIVPAWVPAFLRKRVLPQLPPRGPRRRIFVDRSDARTRRIRGVHSLAGFFYEHGIEIVQLGGMNFLEQAALFRDAELVIANHGAGLSNLIFCDPGTAVLQVLAPGMMEREYRTLSQHGRLRHAYIEGEFADPSDDDLALKDRDLSVDSYALDRAVSLLLQPSLAGGESTAEFPTG